MKNYSVAISEDLGGQLLKHLLRPDHQEDLCFALWYPSEGFSRKTGLLYQAILPRSGERTVHGNAAFLPNYFERALELALKHKAGLAFLHSHLSPGWQGMSETDINTERKIAAAVKSATDLPLIGLTAGTDGAWSARFWDKIGPKKYDKFWCSHVRVIGEALKVTFNEKLLLEPKLKEEFKRTVNAWGENKQKDLMRLTVGIVGAGSVGSIVAEGLARIGISKIKIIDFDSIEIHNLDRTLHAQKNDVALYKAKSKLSAEALKNSAVAEKFNAEAIEYSISEEEGFRHALDCDVIFSCVDRPLARHVLNVIAYAHLIPVIDGGIAVETSQRNQIKRADWKAHIASPKRKCLQCLGQYDIGFVQMEREGYLDNPKYINGLPENHFLKRNENVFAFSLSLASFELLQMLYMLIAPFGLANTGAQIYHFIPGSLDESKFDLCEGACSFLTLTAKGDATGFKVTSPYARAEKMRASRKEFQRRNAFFLKLIEMIRVSSQRTRSFLTQFLK